MNTRVINFFAGPGAGKSTMAGQLYGYMKGERTNVEIVTEYAKDLTWGEDSVTLDDQIAILGEQHRRMYRLLGKVDFIITDSPLLLNAHYAKFGMTKFDIETRRLAAGYLERLALALFHGFRNDNFFVCRDDRTYIRVGRSQTEDEARLADESIRKLMSDYYVSYTDVRTLSDVLGNFKR